jgi:hypothetical protein
LKRGHWGLDYLLSLMGGLSVLLSTLRLELAPLPRGSQDEVEWICIMNGIPARTSLSKIFFPFVCVRRALLPFHSSLPTKLSVPFVSTPSNLALPTIGRYIHGTA